MAKTTMKSRNDEYISSYVIKRLPGYYRFLGELQEAGQERISSKEFAARLKVTSSQIRQDLNCFGEYGQQGYGYNVDLLRKEIGKIIGVEKLNRVIIIGAGNIGQAICDDISFDKRGCVLAGIFDCDPKLHGVKVAGHRVRGMKELEQFCKQNNPEIAVLCIPRERAKEICTELIGYGIKGFWNFSHFDINLHFDDVNVENVHLGDSLLNLVYSVNQDGKYTKRARATPKSTTTEDASE